MIADAANNQLTMPEIGSRLFEAGVLYLSDYVVNAGGIINIAAEVRALERGEAYDPSWVEMKLTRLLHTLDDVLTRSRTEGIPTHVIAEEVAQARLHAA